MMPVYFAELLFMLRYADTTIVSILVNPLLMKDTYGFFKYSI